MSTTLKWTNKEDAATWNNQVYGNIIRVQHFTSWNRGDIEY